MTIPQIRGMYNTDRSRKSTLVDYGFRLPSSLDNRPLNFEEFNQKRNGYPGRLMLEYPDLSDDERSAIWGEYIKEIIQHFKNGNEDTCDQKNEWEEIVNNILLQDFPQIGSCLVYKQINEDDSEEIKELKRTYQKYFAREAELTEYRKSEVQKGFQMLSENFGDLWY